MASQSKAPSKGGRESTYTDAIADHIVGEMVESGRSMVDICGDKGMPNRATVYRWLADQPEFAARVDRAREAMADHAVWKARQAVEGVTQETANAVRVKILQCGRTPAWHRGNTASDASMS